MNRRPFQDLPRQDFAFHYGVQFVGAPGRYASEPKGVLSVVGYGDTEAERRRHARTSFRFVHPDEPIRTVEAGAVEHPEPAEAL